MSAPINTILISGNSDSSLLIRQALADSNYNIIFEGAVLQQLLASPDIVAPELIIVVLESTDLAALEQLKIIYQQFPMPIIIFTNDDRDEAIENAINVGVSAYIVDGMKKNRIAPIVRTACLRFKQHQKTQQELYELKTTLAERKIVDRAKGIVMQQRQCSEDEAYKLLRSAAMKQNLRLSVLAQNIINTADLLSG